MVMLINLHIACGCFYHDSRVLVTETTGPAESKTPTMWPFTEKVC